MQVQAGAPLIPSPVTGKLTNPLSTSRRPLFVGLIAVASVVYLADQLTKAWASANLDPDEPRELVGTLLQLHLTHNPGAAFSIATGSTWVLTLIASTVVLFILFTVRRLGSRGWALALGLLLGGALGNLTDRMLRAPGPGRGHVVDFLQLPNFPVFNIGDSAIVTAAALIGLLAFRGVNVDGTRAVDHTPKHEAAEAPPRDPTSEQSPRHSASDQPPRHSAGTTHDV